MGAETLDGGDGLIRGAQLANLCEHGMVALGENVSNHFHDLNRQVLNGDGRAVGVRDETLEFGG